MPNFTRICCVIIGILAVCIAIGLNTTYNEHVQQLPPIVDEHGNTASIETAMAGLEAYEKAKKTRNLGIASFAFGGLLFICVVITTGKKE